MTVAEELFLLAPFRTCRGVTNNTKKSLDYCYVLGTLNTPNERGM
jgi:hypothetical protein